MMSEGQDLASVRTSATVLQSADGGRFRAVLAEPTAFDVGAPRLPDVLILPDGRGLDDGYEQLAARCAAILGSRALVLDLYGRTAGTGPRRPDFISGEHSAALHWTTVRLDLTTGVNRLRDLAETDAQRRVIAIGCCLGGRVALLAATRRRLRLAGAVAFYPQTSGPARSDLPAPHTMVEMLSCPVLSVFGGADELIPEDQIRSWRAELAVAPVPGEVVVYPGLPHGFFDRRAAEFPVQVADAWARVTRFAGEVT